MMELKTNFGLAVKNLIPRQDREHYFFGYYDLPAFDPTKTYHLVHKVDFIDRLPGVGDCSEIGYLDVNKPAFISLGKTQTWNFQQGAFLQSVGERQEGIVWNTWHNNQYSSCWQDWKNQEIREIPYPLASVSPNGKYGLSINFSRLYDFRPGYGYCNEKDPYSALQQPQEDGITLVDMHTGKGKQIISYKKIAAHFNHKPEYKNEKLVINHITFNSDSSRFLFLVRIFPAIGRMNRTGLGTCDLEGNIYVLRDYTYASHYFWSKKDSAKLLIYGNCGTKGEGDGLYELYDLSQEYHLYPQTFFDQDIHCSYSPEEDFILGDGYPDRDGYRPIFLYHPFTKKGVIAAEIYGPSLFDFDVRCDLHCRWNPGGDKIYFDSLHEGYRSVYEMEIEAVKQHLKNEKGI